MMVAMMMLTPDVPIRGLAETTVGEFWSWAYSDLLNNATRGVFAEYLVAVALGVDDQPRLAWEIATTSLTTVGTSR